MAMFTKQGRWIVQVLKDLGRSQYIGKNGDTIQMSGDNQGALALAKNLHLHERSKHIDICYHFIRDLTEKGKVVTSYINTVDMVVDGMTKPAGRVVFERFKKLLGLMEY
jgi:H2-forming N5,N10-methylenetetrahydromethanopterin dehydrogenase-like enzyme